MHPGEVDVDAMVVQRLLRTQCPAWAHHRLRRVGVGGSDNVLYRLGENLVVRLPWRASAVGQVEKECRWLPRLAPGLPLAVPVPLFQGQPDEGYPWSWSVYRWLPGLITTYRHLADPANAAMLGQFVRALQACDASEAPSPGQHNFFRGVPLAEREDATRRSIDSLRFQIDARAAVAVWERAVRAPDWKGVPAWIHGDLLPANLLVRGERLSAVIDFGGLAGGDPACDVMAAWTCLGPASRTRFRATVDGDQTCWIRARGWALSFGVIALAYYQRTNLPLAATARHAIGEALTDRVT